jgi:23S rRNA pseudouridine2605 synthase
MTQQRLQKVLAGAGVDSRRKCEELILERAVSVNGEVVNRLPVFVDPEKDIIEVNGRKIRPARKIYFLLNKPKGVICTNFDPQGRRRAVDLVKSRLRIYCAGRLDIDTTGLIILTNDSELANRLTHPRYGLSKTYIAEVKGKVTAEQIDRLKRGIWLAEGKTRRSSVKLLKKGPASSLIQIRIAQGLNRQVRRMLARVNLPVKSLKRTKIGKIDSKSLGIGRFRPLKRSEVEYLRKITDSI